MAEEDSVYELEALEKHLQTLLSRCTSEDLTADSKPFCSDFCKLVEEYASHWQRPLPQLRILEIALCYFTRATTFFTLNCDHVLHTLSSLALSVFELLLFFDQKDFNQEPLKNFTVTFQECHLVLARHQNVHFLQVERLVGDGGLWASPALQAILSESSLPQSEVDSYINSEPPVFLELRVRYLLSCERVGEAMALAKCCAWHPAAGQHLFFLQVYLTWLIKTSQHDSLHKEVAGFSGKDAVHVVCSLECEEEDELLLALSRAFLSQQLRRGDMYCLCDLVLIWSELHHRLKTSKQALLEEIHELMLHATNVNSIFPFIRAILQEVGEDGIQFCVELCANALESCLPCDVITKSLIYKTIAGLLPNDLEVCRACALLVFFLERTVEAYKVVYLLYMHPDQEYHVDHSPIRNHVRFETLQVLKKDLYFDPEFWNLITLRTNCLKLMSEKVVSSALEEIMEDKWILNYHTKESGLQSRKSSCRRGNKGTAQASAKKRQLSEDTDAASKRLKVGPRKNVDHTGKRKGTQGSQPLKVASSMPMRRSFWQLDRHQDNGELRRTTRLSEKNPPKRRIRRPKWLVEDSGTVAENNAPPKVKRHGLKNQKYHQPSAESKSEAGQIKNNAKHKPPVNSHLAAKENNKHMKGLSLDSPPADSPPQIILELSLPDNELMGTFNEDIGNRQRGVPQMLFYKPTVKGPAPPQPVKTIHRGEVILRARDAAMFIQQLHCYSRRLKGKGNGQNIQSSVSTITRSSVQGSPPKAPPRVLRQRPATQVKDLQTLGQSAKAASQKASSAQKPAAEKKVASSSLTPAKITESHISEETPRPQSTGQAVSTKTRQAPEESAAQIKAQTAEEVTDAPSVTDKVRQPQTRELCEESAVEMKVTIASQAPTAAKEAPSAAFEKITQAESGKDASKTTSSAELSPEADPTPSASHCVLRDGKQLDVKSLPPQAETEEATDVTPELKVENDKEATSQDHVDDISALTLVTEMVTELSPEALAHTRPLPQKGASKESTAGSQSKVPPRLRTTSSGSGPEQGASALETQDMAPESPENSEAIESEESRLEYCCTFCNKVFKGSRVVAHAMFHYRKDECMFCSVIFKDDLLAMMHLSDHIEKLKKTFADTKDISKPKSSSKAKNANTSSRRSSGRPKKSDTSPKPVSVPDSTPPAPRKLRSSDKPGESPSAQENVSQHPNSKTPVHKVNGHVGKKKELGRLKKDNLEEAKSHKQQELTEERTSNRAKFPRSQEIQDPRPEDAHRESSGPADDKLKVKESLQVLKKADDRVPNEKTAEPQNKCFCPVEGCTWFADVSKNRVAVLYHALEDHHGEVEPLELAFRLGNNRCSICMRVCWSFEHFQHHVERHKLSPRHPCLHQGCTARFKSGMEMRRHARRHNPLQAVCCLPGCPQLFICLWALNLHEKVHYTSKPANQDKKPKPSTVEKKKQSDDEAINDTTVDKTVSTKATRKSTEQAQSSASKQAQASSLGASVEKQELKGNSETRDSHVLKNLSNKDTSAQPSRPSLRLRQTLRKARRTKLARLNRHKVISSSLGRGKGKINSEGRRKRGRPPKSKKDAPDENASTASSTVKTKREPRSCQDSQAEPAETSKESKKAKEEKRPKVQDNVQNTDASSNQLRSRNKQVKKNPASALPATVNRPSPEVTSTADKTHKQTADKINKKPKVKKESSRQTSSSDSSKVKKGRAANCKAGTQMKKKCPVKEAKDASVKPERSDSAVTQIEGQAVEKPVVKPAEEEQKAKVEDPQSTPVSAPVVPAQTPGDKDQEVTTKDKFEEKMTREVDERVRQTHEESSDMSTVKTPTVALTQSSADAEGDLKEETSSSTSSTLAAKKTQTKKPRVKKPSADTPAKKRRLAEKEGDAKKKCKEAPKKAAEVEAKPPAEVGAEGAQGKAPEEPPAQPAPTTPGYSLIVNGQTLPNETRSTVSKELLATYSRKPYLRPPPTAYLDERFITMPKRKKELSLFQSSPRSEPQARATAAQRQRCANCFATFSSAQELQSHVQLKKCSSLFGFDSDDEGEETAT